MDARAELKKVAQEIRLSLSTYVIPLGAWADRIEAIAASLDESAEPVAWPIDREWLWAVLRYARKNPDMFPDVDYDGGKIPVDEENTDTIISAMNSAQPPLEAQVLLRLHALGDGYAAHGHMAIAHAFWEAAANLSAHKQGPTK